MQQDSSPTSSDILQTTAAPTVVSTNTTDPKSSSTSTTAASQEHYFARNPFLSPTSPEHLDSTEAYFYSSSLLSENSNSSSDTCSIDDAMADAYATERGLCQASFVLEYQQLYNRYTLCLAYLQESIKEVDAFRQENDALRIANADLAQRLSLLSQATIQNCLLSDFNRLDIGNDSPSPNIIPNPRSLIERDKIHRCQSAGRVSLPKSISVRSSGYLKIKPLGGVNSGEQTQCSTPPRVSLPNNCGFQQRVFVPGGKREEVAAEFEVYHQGMVKTELCNKWQETGMCPYGENCQFAHGIKELRPVIRHPRYKTEVCRVVLAGDRCPYGHRCHFRHTLTDQEKLIASKYSHSNAT